MYPIRFSNRERSLTVFPFLIAIVIAVTSITCGKQEKKAADPAQNDDVYTLELRKDRKEKDLHFLTDDSSPLLATDKENFRSLVYYEPAPEFIFFTMIHRTPRATEFTIQTSKNKPRVMMHVGYIPFMYEGKEYRLQAFAPKDTSEDGLYYFVPFKDATNGTETYGAGRFLDFDHLQNDSLILDFNYAYNPYCAYNDRYNCPIPPAENHLPIAIRAGEKRFKEGH